MTAVVSFDFDGVLHQSVKVDRWQNGLPFCYGPIDYADWQSWSTHESILEQIDQEIWAGHELVIVSARDIEYEEYALAYLDKLGIRDKFKTIRCGCKNKVKVLQELGAICHYEDSLKHITACREAGIEVVQIYPLSDDIFQDNN